MAAFRFRIGVIRGLCWLLGCGSLPAVHAQGYTFTVLAGRLDSAGHVNATGSAARFNGPLGITVDATGNVFVADNHTVRKITPAGVVTTLAGQPGVTGAADGTGAAARFSVIYGLATDAAGNVYVADTHNHTVRKVTPAGVVTTLAGVPGTSGLVDGPALSARFSSPYGIACDANGNLIVGDAGSHVIRRISAAGQVTTLAGSPGVPGISDGTAGAARFDLPAGIALDSAGNAYVADYNNDTVRKVTPAGEVTTLAGAARVSGYVDGPGLTARFSSPRGLAVDRAGVIYVVEDAGRVVRRIAPDGGVTTLAGAYLTRGSTDGVGSAARFDYPSAAAVDEAGNLFVADTRNNTVRVLRPQGVVSTVAGAAPSFGFRDGVRDEAQFRVPYGITVDASGTVYVTEFDNHTIRRILPGGIVTTLAGTPGIEGTSDGTAEPVRFRNPTGITLAANNAVYVTDLRNHTVRRVVNSSLAPVVAGTAGMPGSTDGIGAAARFYNPVAVFSDPDENLFIVDAITRLLRRMTPAGAVTTVATLTDPHALPGTRRATCTWRMETTSGRSLRPAS